jgi:hypothetical protein
VIARTRDHSVSRGRYVGKAAAYPAILRAPSAQNAHRALLVEASTRATLHGIAKAFGHHAVVEV